ncbi:Ger(x)C family spore germination protein [Bacillus taeanensis]|uniref:Spore germination GerAC-like C-terminal domain-containing protein n=1 Tax=Bacillus taeanensis TaxID=273032 RepID=A0A366Y491_9BACI|nr:Ger(x)C family spore germination protein [Bacillus taeanensis]RBW71233.1 hypothetical protein DS031_00320 [Bacillus taeanensis]
MIIANGKAKDMLEIEPTKDQIPALKFLALSENVGEKMLRAAQPLTVGDLSEKLSAESSFLMQYLVATEGEETRLTGAAVISGKEKKIVGLLNKEEVTGLNWLLGEGIGGVIEGIDKETGESILYEIADIKSKIKTKVEKDDISFNVTVESEGRLSEDWVLYSDAFKNEFLNKAEKAIENEVNHLIKKGLEKTQKEFHVDVTGFREQLRIQYPKEWEKVKENWDERFSEVPINIKVKINIRQFQTQGRKIDKKE